MKKKILAGVLSAGMLAALLTPFAGAVPYTPSATAYKDFGQEHIYIYEVTKGEKAPAMDGFVKETDGYGEPVTVHGLTYTTTADKVVYDDDLQPLSEYVMREDGTYFVYPTPQSSEEVWASISALETKNGSGYVCAGYATTTTYSTSSSYYYLNPNTGSFARAYQVRRENLVETKDADGNVTQPKVPYVVNTSSTGISPVYLTKEPYVLTTEKPADWEEHPYYYFTYTPSAGGTAPSVIAYDAAKKPSRLTTTTEREWVPNKYYYRKPVTVNELYLYSEGITTAAATLANMKKYHVVLPEEIRVYARYDNTYLYTAIEVDEPAHTTRRYNNEARTSVNASNYMMTLGGNTSIVISYRKLLDGSAPTASLSTGLCRVYGHSSTALSADGRMAGIYAKYGRTDTTTFSEIYTANHYNITHQSYTQIHGEPAAPTEEDELGGDMFGDDMFSGDETGASGEGTSSTGSGTYGTTTYEYRQPWTVLNDDYSPNTDKTAVPEKFFTMNMIQLENNLADACYTYNLSLPRDTRQLPGSLYNTTGNYSKTLYTMRYNSNSNLTTGDNFGTYRWSWAAISSGYSPFNREYVISDYASLSSKKTVNSSHIYDVWYTAGQELGEDYKKPEYVGTQLRTDGGEEGGIRVLINVPKSSKDILEAGCIVAPTEVSRRNQLYLGLTSIHYYAEEYNEYYGIVDGKWINLCDDADKYFAASTTPPDSDSYLTSDIVGGKPSGIYTVHTLKADLNNPYLSKNSYDQYALELNGLYDDFDDFFTFYTIRPYIRYSDGTIAYGEYEYKSPYYIACWTIQEMCNAYNESQSLSGTNQYSLAEMSLTTAKDENGKTILVPSTTSPTSQSSYACSAATSIYEEEARLRVFRWFAVRTVNRQSGVSLRVNDYENFSEDAKESVDSYVEMFEYIFQTYIKNCEGKRYIAEK